MVVPKVLNGGQQDRYFTPRMSSCLQRLHIYHIPKVKEEIPSRSYYQVLSKDLGHPELR